MAKNKFSPLLLLGALAAFLPALHSAPPILKEATVTIPYEELRALWEAAQDKVEEPPPAPPVPAALHRAKYTLDVQAGSLRAEFEAESFAPGWQFVPILGKGMRPLSAEGDDAARLVPQGDTLGLLFEKPGRKSVTLTFDASGLQPGASPIAITGSPATTTTLMATGLTQGQQLLVDGEPAANPGPLMAAGGTAKIGIGEREEAVPDTPSIWEIRPEVLAEIGGARSQFQAHLFCHADSGGGRELTFLLPSNTTVRAVEGDDVARWSSQRSGSRRAFTAHFQTPGILDRELHITYDLPQPPSAESWQLPAPMPADSEPAPALFVVPQPQGLELAADGLAPTDATTRLPAWMRERVEGRPAHVLQSPTTPRLTATWLPTVEIAGATVANASFDLQLVEDGSSLLAAEYTIENGAPLDWKLSLPPDARLLSCEVNGKPAKPIDRGEGALEFPLPNPKPGQGEKGSSSQVRLSYAARTAELDPVSGMLVLQLPRTALFTHAIDWEITIPTGYKVTAIESNCSTGTCGDPNKILLHKRLCRDEAPAAEIHYQKTALK